MTDQIDYIKAAELLGRSSIPEHVLDVEEGDLQEFEKIWQGGIAFTQTRVLDS